MAHIVRYPSKYGGDSTRNSIMFRYHNVIFPEMKNAYRTYGMVQPMSKRKLKNICESIDLVNFHVMKKRWM